MSGSPSATRTPQPRRAPAASRCAPSRRAVPAKRRARSLSAAVSPVDSLPARPCARNAPAARATTHAAPWVTISTGRRARSTAHEPPSAAPTQLHQPPPARAAAGRGRPCPSPMATWSTRPRSHVRPNASGTALTCDVLLTRRLGAAARCTRDRTRQDERLIMSNTCKQVTLKHPRARLSPRAPPWLRSVADSGHRSPQRAAPRVPPAQRALSARNQPRCTFGYHFHGAWGAPRIA